MTFIKSICTSISISFLPLPSVVLALDLPLSSAIFFNRLLWSISTSCLSILPVWRLLTEDLIFSYCWKWYLNFYVFIYISISFLISIFLIFFRKSPSVDSSSWFSFGCKDFKASACFIPWFSIVFISFSNALPKGEYVN